MGFKSFLSKLVTHAIVWGLIATTYFFKDATAFNLAMFLTGFTAAFAIGKLFFGGGVNSFGLATSTFGKILDALFTLSGFTLVGVFATNAAFVPATLLGIVFVLRIAAYEQVKAASNPNEPVTAPSTLAAEMLAKLDAAVVAAQTSAKVADSFEVAAQTKPNAPVVADPVPVVAVDPVPAAEPEPAVVEPVAAVVVPEPTPAPVTPVPALTVEQQIANLTQAFTAFVQKTEAKVEAAV
jgi:hypothetical protein